MAGHSHWANIQHRKAAVDAKRGKQWSKMSRAIIIAARNGGGDPVMNLKLRYAIDKARQVSMPKDTIEKAIKRGTGELEGIHYEEVTFEGFAPGGVAVMAEVMTDNRNRTNGEVRKIFERGGGNVGSPGCVGYLFERKGLFSIPASTIDEDRLMELALDAGAEDVQREGDAFAVTCEPSAFSQVQEKFQAAGLAPTVAEVTQLPKTQVAADAETARKVLKLLEMLDDHDDVQHVHHNLEIPREVMDELASA